jgi:hypothetical protein
MVKVKRVSISTHKLGMKIPRFSCTQHAASLRRCERALWCREHGQFAPSIHPWPSSGLSEPRWPCPAANKISRNVGGAGSRNLPALACYFLFSNLKSVVAVQEEIFELGWVAGFAWGVEFDPPKESIMGNTRIFFADLGARIRYQGHTRKLPITYRSCQNPVPN